MLLRPPRSPSGTMRRWSVPPSPSAPDRGPPMRNDSRAKARQRDRQAQKSDRIGAVMVIMAVGALIALLLFFLG